MRTLLSLHVVTIFYVDCQPVVVFLQLIDSLRYSSASLSLLIFLSFLPTNSVHISVHYTNLRCGL